MFFLIPFATDCERRRPPIMTVALIVLNSGVWVMQFYADADRLAELMFLPAAPTLLGSLMSMFMHSWPFPFHLAGNMFFLYVFGSALEDRMGPWLYLLLYLAGGICADIGHLAVAYTFSPEDLDVPVIGASGAVMAVVGMFSVRFYRNKVKIWYFVWLCMFIRIGTFALGALWAVGYYVSQDLTLGLLGLTQAGEGGGVAHWAHIGGFVFGGGVALALGLHRAADTEYVLSDTELTTVYEGTQEFARLEAVVQREPGNMEASIRLAQAYVGANRPTDAQQIWVALHRRLLRTGSPPQVAAYLTRVPERHIYPQLSPDEQYQTALALEKAGEYARALQWLQAVIQREDAGDSAEVAMLRQAIIQRDRLADPAAAAQFFGAFLERFPDSQWVDFARQGQRDCERT